MGRQVKSGIEVTFQLLALKHQTSRGSKFRLHQCQRHPPRPRRASLPPAQQLASKRSLADDRCTRSPRPRRSPPRSQTILLPRLPSAT